MNFRKSILLNNLIPTGVFSLLIIVVLIFLQNFTSQLNTITDHDFTLASNTFSMIHEVDVMHSNLLEYIDGEQEEKDEFRRGLINFNKIYQANLAYYTPEESILKDTIRYLIDRYSSEANQVFELYNPDKEAWAIEQYEFIEVNYGRVLEIKLNAYKEEEVDDAGRSSNFNQLLYDDLPGVRYYLELIDEGTDLLLHINKYIAGNLRSKVEYIEDAGEFEYFLKKLEAIEQKPHEKEAIAEIKNYFKQIDEGAQSIFTSYNPANKTKALQTIETLEHSYLATLHHFLSSAAYNEKTDASNAAHRLQNAVSTMNIIAILILLGGLSGTVFLSYYISRRLYAKLGGDPNDLVELTDIDDYEQLKPINTQNRFGLNKAISEMINRLQGSLSSVLYNTTISETLSGISKEFVLKDDWKKNLELLALRLQETFHIHKVAVILLSEDKKQDLILDFIYPSESENMFDLAFFKQEEILIRLKNRRVIKQSNLEEYGFVNPDNNQVCLLPVSVEDQLDGFLYLERKAIGKDWIKMELDSLVLISEIIGQSLNRIISGRALNISRENYRSIFNNSYDAILLCKHNGDVIESNVAFRKLIKEEMATNVTYNIYKFIESRNINNFDQWFKTIPNQKNKVNMEMTVVTQQGDEKILQMSGHTIQYSKEEIIILFFNDITEHKLREKEIRDFNKTLEEKINERTRQLEATNAELESFSYSVSHDLRAPLRAIAGFGNIIKEDYSDKLDDEGKQYIDNIVRNSERMGRLIDEILAFSRLHRSSIKKQPINLTKLFNDELNNYKTNNKLSKLEYVVPELPMATGAPELIKQVVHNLVSNAVKYSSKEEKPIIEVGSTQENNETIYFIKDNGVGFNNKYKSKLFGVFQRLHSDNEFEGTGVGLAFVQRIIFKHGGRIWGAGEVNQGATFYFTLPD